METSFTIPEITLDRKSIKSFVYEENRLDGVYFNKKTDWIQIGRVNNH